MSFEVATAAKTHRAMEVSLCDDREKWNAAVLENGSWLYQSWEFGELRAHEGWTPWRVLVEDGDNNRVALQILEHKLPGLPYSLMYAPRPGRPVNIQLWVELTSWLNDFLRARKALFLRLDPNVLETDQDAIESLGALGFRWLPHQHWSAWGNLPRAWMIVDISRPEEAILQGMRKAHRQAARKQGGGDLKISFSHDTMSGRNLHSMLLKTAERQQFPIRDLPYFARFAELFVKTEQGRIFVAENQGVAVAVIACVVFGRSCFYLHGGFDYSYHKLNPNPILHWKAIQWAKSRGCTEYNLIGAGTRMPPEEGNAGFNLYRFKQGFGAELRQYAGYFDLVNYRAAYSLFRLAEENANGTLYRSLTQIQKLMHLKG